MARWKIAPNGRWLVYTPADLFTGMDRFEYTVDDVLTTSVAVEVEPWRSRFVSVWCQSLCDPIHARCAAERPVRPRLLWASAYTSISDPPAAGSIEIVDGGSSLRFTPVDAATGNASFSYVVDGLFEARVSVWIVGFLAAIQWSSSRTVTTTPSTSWGTTSPSGITFLL